MAEIVNEGQPCKKCFTPVVRKEGKLKKKSALKYTYYYEWFFKCPKCRTVYLVPNARREITEEQREQVLGSQTFREKEHQAQSLFD